MRTPWIAVGDYNNVLTNQDKVGGNIVTEAEYIDLSNMMQITCLFESITKDCHFTWSNKYTTGVIYSRIDRMIGNVE